MNDCARFEETIRAHVAGEPVPDDGGALARHAELCAACRALLAVHGLLVELGASQAADEPDPARFAAMRAAVIQRIRSDRATAGIASAAPHPPRARIMLRPVAAMAAAVLLFVTGFAAARFRLAEGASGVDEPLLRQITTEAATNHSLLDVEDSPFTYSDVTLRALADGRVALDFDVTRHVSTVENASSPLVQDVLAQALLNPTHTGSRLKAIALAAGTMSPKVRDALIFALHHDDNLAVRLKALSILSEHPGADAAIESAVLTTLRQDESVQMRLSALDYLAEQHLDPDAIRRAIDSDGSDDPSAAALMVRLGEYERSAQSRPPQ